jgi:formylglycine-generating enzyme required for sulfatase activity
MAAAARFRQLRRRILQEGVPASRPHRRLRGRLSRHLARWSFQAFQHGLYDLAGNVWEWCEDWYDPSQKYRVVRGGSWNIDDRALLLSSFRDFDEPVVRYVSLGFRVVLGVEGSAR